jgi:hypothetical protein
MAIKSATNITVSYNSNDITQYCNSADLQATLNQLDVTDLASTGKEFLTDVAEWRIRLNIWWAKAIDDILGPDIVTPGTKRTAYIEYEDSTGTVRYTWTSNAEIGNYQITAGASAAMAGSAELILSGAPSRTTPS